MNESNNEGSENMDVNVNDLPGEHSLHTGDTGDMNEKTLNIVTQMQETLNIFLRRVDKTSEDVNKLHKDIHGENGIEARLEEVSTETDDQTACIAELRAQNAILTTEVELLKSYVIKMEQKVNVHDSRIDDLTARSMRDNLIITGVKENEGERLNDIIDEIIKKKLKLPSVKFDRLHRIGPKTSRTSIYPRPIVGKCSEYRQKDAVLRCVDLLPEGIRIFAQYPESHRENRKRAKDLQHKYNQSEITTKVVGDKLVFGLSGEVHREKVRIPKAESIFKRDKSTKREITHSEVLVDGENKFQAHTVRVKNVSDAREATKQILQMPEIARATHNILACKYTDRQGSSQDSVDDDGEYGAGRKILKFINDKNIDDILVIVSRWNPKQRLGHKRFTDITTCALEAIRALVVE